MNVARLSHCLVILTMLLVARPNLADAAVRLIIAPIGGNVFVLQGQNLDGIAVLDFEINYDPAVLANPQGTRGGLIPSDAIFNFNPSAPGMIRLFIRMGSKAVAGSGSLATISFEGSGPSEGSIVSLTANLVTVKATPAVAQVQIMSRLKPAVPVDVVGTSGGEIGDGDSRDATIKAGNSSARPPAKTSDTAGGIVALGSVTMPGTPTEMSQERPEKKEAPPLREPASEQIPAETLASAEPRGVTPDSSVAKPVQPPETIAYMSVLDRVKEYSGPRTSEALISLFKPETGAKILQEPAVAVSDGESVVSLHIILPLTMKDVPRFSLRNATLMTLEQADDGGWTIGVRPQKNTLDARVAVRFDSSEILYPLVVVPPVDSAVMMLKGSAEATFTYFLSQREGHREPVLDLNRDGNHDYIDDFIFTAHYLAVGKTVAADPAKPQRQTSP